MLFCDKSYPHWPNLRGFSIVCVRIWCVRYTLIEKKFFDNYYMDMALHQSDFSYVV